MGDLLYRIVFNSEERKTLMEMMDEALANNELHELSLKALELLGDGFHHAEGEQLWIDWKEVGDKVDPNLRDNTLAAVFKLQNWDSKASSIGFKIEEGALIRADIENRDLIVDEYNKSLPDSETPLQIVMQVLNGETKRHIVNLGGKGSYELVNAHESGKGNLFLATGNHPKDGTGTRKMSDSWNRRMQPFTIPSFTQDDWYDRTAQILTGLPIPILERMVPGKWTGDKWQVNDPKAFTETLLMLQTLGMTDAQRVRVPEWQTSLITHWETALPPIEKLAHFYYKWQQLVDRDSPLMKSGKFPGILMEIDDDLVPVEKVTPSTMIGHINEAKVLSPKARPAEQSGGFSLKTNWDIPVQTRKVEAEPIAKNFGSRLVASILDEIERTTLQKGKKELYEQLMEDAKEAGLIGNPPPLAAALHAGDTPAPLVRLSRGPSCTGRSRLIRASGPASR